MKKQLAVEKKQAYREGVADRKAERLRNAAIKELLAAKKPVLEELQTPIPDREKLLKADQENIKATQAELHASIDAGSDVEITFGSDIEEHPIFTPLREPVDSVEGPEPSDNLDPVSANSDYIGFDMASDRGLSDSDRGLSGSDSCWNWCFQVNAIRVNTNHSTGTAFLGK